MKRAMNKFYRDERGVVVVMIGAIIALLLVFSVMAIDATQMMLVRTQLQNAADAGAIAGALVGGLTGDTTLAQDEAILAAGVNNALVDSSNARNTMSSVVINDADVTFPESKKIVVTTHRTEATGDQFLNYFMRIFDENNLGPGNMTARAAAEFFWVCGASCVEPWCPPDRWCDSAGTGDCMNGNGSFEPELGEYYDPIGTGYTAADLGTQITLVVGDGNSGAFSESWYYSIDFPPLNDLPPGENPNPGGNDYRDWICDCVSPTCGCQDAQEVLVDPGDLLQVEPGKKIGPNQGGGGCLVDSDPNAVWDVATGTVINSDFPVSPRIVKLAFFDPTVGKATDLNGRPYVKVAKIVVIFVESVQQGNDVQITGRFMRRSEPGGAVCANQNDPTFLFTTKLVE